MTKPEHPHGGPPGQDRREAPPPLLSPPRDRAHVYRVADVHKVTDGDTFWLYLDVGFYLQHLTHIRLHGFDTPELFKPANPFEHEAAQRARLEVMGWLAAYRDRTFVRTQPDPDSFGRWLGQVWAERDGQVVSELGFYLEGKDLATRWPTRWREVHGR